MSMQITFFQLCDELKHQVSGDEIFSLYYDGEETDFVRFNKAKIRQAGQVLQGHVTLTLTQQQRQTSAQVSLTGEHAVDSSTLSRKLEQLKKDIELLPVDPNLSVNELAQESNVSFDAPLPDSADLLSQFFSNTQRQDVVGILTSGVMYRGYADSQGSQHWFQTTSFDLDWSLYLENGRAVKNNLAGQTYDESLLAGKVRDDLAQASALSRPEIDPGPGDYRAYISPAALQELLGLLAWGDLSLRSQKTHQSALMPLINGTVEWDQRVTLQERQGDGLANDFNATGFYNNEPVTLVNQGAFTSALINPTDAREFNETWNSISREPRALMMNSGSLAEEDILSALDTGLYLSNLWYCNYSDRQSARMTGMTRYACLWVERGKIVGPLASMRFDISLHKLLSNALLGLTENTELMLSNNTYGQRHLGGTTLPGMLVDKFTLTL